MIPTLAYPNGGRPNKNYGRIVVDKATSKVGYLVGYVPKGIQVESGEAILIPISEFKKFTKDFCMDIKKDCKKEKTPIRLRVGKWLSRENLDLEYEPKRIQLPDGSWIQR